MLILKNDKTVKVFCKKLYYANKQTTKNLMSDLESFLGDLFSAEVGHSSSFLVLLLLDIFLLNGCPQFDVAGEVQIS